MLSMAPMYFPSRNSTAFGKIPLKEKLDEKKLYEIFNLTTDTSKSDNDGEIEKIKLSNKNSFTQLYNCIDNIPDSLDDNTIDENILTRLYKQNMKSDARMFLLISIDILKIINSKMGLLDIMKIISFSQVFRIKLGVQLSANANIDSSVEKDENHKVVEEFQTPMTDEQRDLQCMINEMNDDSITQVHVSALLDNSPIEKIVQTD